MSQTFARPLSGRPNRSPPPYNWSSRLAHPWQSPTNSRLCKSGTTYDRKRDWTCQLARTCYSQWGTEFLPRPLLGQLWFSYEAPLPSFILQEFIWVGGVGMRELNGAKFVVMGPARLEYSFGLHRQQGLRHWDCFGFVGGLLEFPYLIPIILGLVESHCEFSSWVWLLSCLRSILNSWVCLLIRDFLNFLHHLKRALVLIKSIFLPCLSLCHFPFSFHLQDYYLSYDLSLTWVVLDRFAFPSLSFITICRRFSLVI